ncbi:P27 family phage terminase small subunit [Proteus terrae]|uniref:P27 family phage terminase small subunit n=1 Tax=Proteus terrae TaxID=1574161 RepID=UPI00217E6935|nr:P27 family phage terminase small subunit [Proteus terrae]MCS6715228.1 P27 family phage terminase small subunit [Proteus terrae]MCS6733866.1 P27 family phage terminase small subunit [Proteus terrae]
MAGRRPKPTHLKVVTGNPGKRKLNDKDPQSKREIPSPPEHLTDWGKIAWAKLTLLLDGMGVLTVADTLALERLCDIYADILQLRDTIAIEGRTYTTKTQLGDFLIKANPAVAMLIVVYSTVMMIIMRNFLLRAYYVQTVQDVQLITQQRYKMAG